METYNTNIPISVFETGETFLRWGRETKGVIMTVDGVKHYGFTHAWSEPVGYASFNWKLDRTLAKLPKRNYEPRQWLSVAGKSYIEVGVHIKDDYWYTGYTAKPKTRLGIFFWNMAHGRMMQYPWKDVFGFSFAQLINYDKPDREALKRLQNIKD